MGTLSNARTGAPQVGQREPGRTTDSPRGTRTMATLKKLPQIAPNNPAVAVAQADERKPRPSPMRVDAKVPGALKGNYVVAVAVSLVALGAGACGKRAGKPEAQPAALGDAVRPAFLAGALRKLGGGTTTPPYAMRWDARAPRPWRSPPPRTCGSTGAATIGCARRTTRTAAGKSS